MDAVAEVLSAFDRLAAIATELAEDLKHPDGQHVWRVGGRLCEFLCELVDGDVAFCRTMAPDGKMVLASDVHWASWMAPVGRVASKKLIDDGICNPWHTGTGNRDANCSLRGDYSEEEMDFFRWLRSEAWISVAINEVPRAVLVIGKGTPDHFSEERVKILEWFEPFVRAFIHAAEYFDDWGAKTRLLQSIGAVLPSIQAAPNPRGFHRAICTLLTCHWGFRFDRAMLFEMNAGVLPAECKMAVGGTGHDWVQRQSDIAGHFGSLKAYIRDSLEHPLPGEGAGNILDPLHDLVCKNPLYFSKDDDSALPGLLAKSSNPTVGVQKLSDADPWIVRVNQERPGAFCARNPGAYYLFPLLPLDVKDPPAPLGFVLTDLAYRGPHVPYPEYPDLEMCSLVIRLLTQLWMARQDAESHLHWLSAVPTLRHAAPDLGAHVGELENCIQDGDWAAVKTELGPVVERTKELQQAVGLIEGMQKGELAETVTDVVATVGSLCQTVEPKYDGRFENLNVSVRHAVCNVGAGVRMPPHYLESIFHCLVDNAVSAALAAGRKTLEIHVKIGRLKLPRDKKAKFGRVEVSVGNDGPPIPKDLAPYLFMDHVSTHEMHKQHRGSGLSSARRQATAFGGEVVLLSHDPVEFAIVLEPLEPPADEQGEESADVPKS